MAIVCLFLTACLSWAAFRTDDQAARWLWAVFAAGNLIVAVHMMSTDFKYAYRLAPNEFNERPGRIR
jgi:hypothetical protein